MELAPLVHLPLLRGWTALPIYRLHGQHTVPSPCWPCCLDTIGEHTWTRFVF